MSFEQPPIADNIVKEISSYINNYRTKHQATPLTWDNNIAAFSQQWSFYLLSNNLFQHSQNKSYGENLAMFQGYGSNILELFKMAIDSWYNEVKSYDFNSPGFSSGTGHFTCLVWKSSKTFGMGFSINPTTEKVCISFNTSPPGNISEEFVSNVFPVIQMPTPSPTPTPLPVPSPIIIPVPTPTPHPTPLPMPVPQPVPIISKNNKIINELHNISYALQVNFSVYAIINIINHVITELNENPSIYGNLINNLNRIIYGLQHGQNRTQFIHEIAIWINEMRNNV
jgi:hypothetical protein